MKKILFLIVLAFGINYAYAQSGAEIKFETLTHDFGTFSESDPIVSYEFKFTNVGDAPLVINQAAASCGCTIPDYTKEPILPGKSGTIKVTYNGAGRGIGPFEKSITIRSNSKTELIRLRIVGNMTERVN